MHKSLTASKETNWHSYEQLQRDSRLSQGNARQAYATVAILDAVR
jgi:hypothetical protein